MTWTLWALLLIAHGALSRWVQTRRQFILAAVIADGLLIAIGLITVDQLQGLSALEILRVGLFFAAFGASGRQLMHSILGRFEPQAAI